MLKITSVLFFLVLPTAVSAQINMFEILEHQYALDLDPESYPQLKFEWNFDGKIQASLNTGLTEMVDNKDYLKALESFNEAVAGMPSLVPARYYRAICFKVLDSLDRAKEDLEKAFGLAPESAEILLELAEIHELKHEYSTAEKLYAQAIEMDPVFAPVYFNLGNLSMRQQLFPKARRYFKKCVGLDPSFKEAHVRQGILAFASDKKPSKTIEHFNNAVAIDSTFQPALFWRGRMFLRDEDVPKCLADWNKLVLYNPENPLFVMLRAFLYYDLKDYENAFIDLKKIFSKQYTDENLFRGAQSRKDRILDLQFAVSYMNRTIYGLDDEPGIFMRTGFCLMVMDRKKEAITSFKRSFTLQPSPLSLFLIAIAYEHSEKHDSAFFYYGDALKYDNDIFDAHKKRAIYFSELKDWKNAYRHFEEMIRLEPGLTVTYRLRSLIRVHFKDYYGAIMDLTRFLKLDSTDHEIYLYRAHCKKEVKDFKGANSDYRKAIEVRPEKYELYEYLVESDLQLNDTTHALLTIKKCEEELGLQPYLMSVRVRVLIRQRKFAEAREQLTKTREDKFRLSMLPKETHSLLYYLEAWIDYLEKNHESALRKLNTALKHNSNNYEAMYLRSKMFIARGEKMKAMNDLKLLAAAGYSDSQALLDGLK